MNELREVGLPSPQQVFEAFPRCRILVVGDLMLDRYIWGEVARISPEAPVPIVKVARRSAALGGAANVAMNLVRLGVGVAVAGYVGEDAGGDELRSLVRDNRIEDCAIVSVAGRPTTTKTRVIGAHQQMMRIDDEVVLVPEDAAADKLLELCRNWIEKEPIQALVFSDYAKGCLDERLCRSLITMATQAGLPVLVDPKGKNYERYRGATAVSPNLAELCEATGITGASFDGVLSAATRLQERLELDFLVVTRGERGLSLVTGDVHHHLTARAKEVYDVSGAGDTVTAVLAASLAAGFPPLTGLTLANLAAGVVVGKLGTAPIERDELLAAMLAGDGRVGTGKVVRLDMARTMVERWRSNGERIVFTNGCFDLLHLGHVTYLDAARKRGDRLVVGLNSDASVSRLKGEGRPTMPDHARAGLLAALAAVDLVVVFNEDTPLELICALKPDVLAKGADYSEDQVVGAAEIRSWGGEVVLVPLLEGHSSTAIRARMVQQDA